MPQDSAEVLYNLIEQALVGNETFEEIETQIQQVAGSAGIDGEQVAVVIDRFRQEKLELKDLIPRLLVDWGELPQVGRKVSPEFSLLCPAYDDRPKVDVLVDKDLDHDPDDQLRRLEFDGSGIWNFHVPFQMKSNGMDCNPGHYIIDVRVSFRNAPSNAARFYRCRIDLKVPDLNSEQGGVLEIDGDGQSMVNLQGHNLKQFSKVVLKGGDSSVINLQNSSLGTEDSSSAEEGKPTTSFEYDLKVNNQVQARLPRVVQSNHRRANLNAGAFCFEDGRRVLIYSKPRITFGRSRDNDVALRFFPRSPENDNHSRNISRTHFIAELIPDGIEIKDESRSGIELDYNVVQDRHVIATQHVGEVCEIRLGVLVSESLELEMTTFGPDQKEDLNEVEFWHEIYCDAVGGRPSRLSRDSLSQGLDSIRFDRLNNLSGEESYVMLFREALIGGDPNRCPFTLTDHSLPAVAKIHFLDRRYWLEPISSQHLPTIDGTPLALHTLTPLVPEMKIQFGNEFAIFDLPKQMYLD
jgi:hypothetical protein